MEIAKALREKKQIQRPIVNTWAYGSEYYSMPNIGKMPKTILSKEIAPLVNLLRNKSWFADGVTLLFRSAADKKISERRCRGYSTWISAKDKKLADKMDIYIDEMRVAGLINRGPTLINSPLFPLWKNKEKGTIRPIFDCRILNEKLLTRKFLLPDTKQFIQVKQAADYIW